MILHFFLPCYDRFVQSQQIAKKCSVIGLLKWREFLFFFIPPIPHGSMPRKIICYY